MRRGWCAALLLCAAAAGAHAQQGAGDVVFVPTPQVVVDTMLTMANVGPKDYLIDLGSGALERGAGFPLAGCDRGSAHTPADRSRALRPLPGRTYALRA
jgi:hypothetical protein